MACFGSTGNTNDSIDPTMNCRPALICGRHITGPDHIAARASESLSLKLAHTDVEPIADLVQVISMAPGIDGVDVFVAFGDAGGINNALAAIATSNPLDLQISSSVTWAPSDPQAADPWFKRMQAQGQNFLQASGDSAGDGIYTCYHNENEMLECGAVAGTSIAAPLWAGFLALTNELTKKDGLPPPGGALSLFYRFGGFLHDVSAGIPDRGLS